MYAKYLSQFLYLSAMPNQSIRPPFPCFQLNRQKDLSPLTLACQAGHMLRRLQNQIHLSLDPQHRAPDHLFPGVYAAPRQTPLRHLSSTTRGLIGTANEDSLMNPVAGWVRDWPKGTDSIFIRDVNTIQSRSLIGNGSFNQMIDGGKFDPVFVNFIWSIGGAS